jgi:hypothetical protein
MSFVYCAAQKRRKIFRVENEDSCSSTNVISPWNLPDVPKTKLVLWNHVGHLYFTNQNEIGFNVHITFNNPNKLTVSFMILRMFAHAALSNHGVLLVTKQSTKGDDIFYFAFGTERNEFGDNESFHLSLLEGEQTCCAECGDGWIAIITSQRLLRVFSSTGIQLKLVSFCGLPVKMTSALDYLAVVYRDDVAIAGFEFKIELHKITSSTSNKIVGDQHFPLAKHIHILWLGFDINTMFLWFLDSGGRISSFTKHLSGGSYIWHWTLVLQSTFLENKFLVYMCENQIFYLCAHHFNLPRNQLTISCLLKQKCISMMTTPFITNELQVCTNANLSSYTSIYDHCLVANIGTYTQDFINMFEIKILNTFQNEIKHKSIPKATNLALILRTRKALEVAETISTHFQIERLSQFVRTLRIQRDALTTIMHDKIEANVTPKHFGRTRSIEKQNIDENISTTFSIFKWRQRSKKSHEIELAYPKKTMLNNKNRNPFAATAPIPLNRADVLKLLKEI